MRGGDLEGLPPLLDQPVKTVAADLVALEPAIGGEPFADCGCELRPDCPVIPFRANCLMNAQYLCHADEICQRSGFHFAHYAFAMRFDRPFGRTQFDHLIT